MGTGNRGDRGNDYCALLHKLAAFRNGCKSAAEGKNNSHSVLHCRPMTMSFDFC